MSVVAYLLLFLLAALALTWLRIQSYRQLHPVRRARAAPPRSR